MNKSESIKELAAALAKAQGAMGAAKMDAVNPFLKNRYADLGSVIQAAKPALSANGLSYTQHPTFEDSHVTVTTVLMHASGEWIESSLTLPVSDNRGLSAAQAMGAVITYLRRYTLASILGIYADEDTDGNDKPNGNGKAAEKPAEKPAPNGNGNNGKPPAQPAPAVQPQAAPPEPAPVVVDEQPHVTYTGALAKIGKDHAFPTLWGQALMRKLNELGGNAYHLGGILWKLNIPQETTPARVVEMVKEYLAQQ